MKWRNRIAQGFSPGSGRPKIRPESGDRESERVGNVVDGEKLLGLVTPKSRTRTITRMGTLSSLPYVYGVSNRSGRFRVLVLFSPGTEQQKAEKQSTGGE